MGREATHTLTDDCYLNACETVKRVNQLLSMAALDGVFPEAVNESEVASGWRPAEVNAATPNAAPDSKHVTGQACDLRDNKARDFARWCLRNLEVLDDLGLWLENPMWTGGKSNWVHLQTVPPHSGRRVFVPSDNPPLAAALPEQEQAHSLA